MTTGLDEQTPLIEVLRHPVGHKVLRELAPNLVGSALLHTYMMKPLGLLLLTEDGLDVDKRSEILVRISALPPVVASVSPKVPEPIFSSDYEDEQTSIASASMKYSSEGGVWERFEVEIEGPTHRNPYTDVELRVDLIGPNNQHHLVLGFYDGGGIYRFRFLPSQPGSWTFSVSSNARSLQGLSGQFVVRPTGSRGPVRISDGFHFKYADGTAYLPIGTTCYAWTHQERSMEEQTLASLAAARFTKVRMCVFPKSYTFNSNEPERLPFQRTDNGWDSERFDPDYWSHLEERIDQLAALGIEADLILFHAYDRWGFAEMDPVADDRYVRYAVARLSAFTNVWWSLANEYDLLAKTIEDWERWASIIQKWDSIDHLRSIHNCIEIYDHSRPWVTHVSMQGSETEKVTAWREMWGKPVVVDECAYEGNIDQGWGNISGQELTRRAWEGATRGGYVGHGETYLDPRDVLWWSKGGQIHGSSAERFGFLAQVNSEAPHSQLNPLQLEWDVSVAGVLDEELLYYFGLDRPAFRWFFHDPSVTWTVDIIDTWNMTVERLADTFSGRFRVELPAREYIAVRLRRQSERQS